MFRHTLRSGARLAPIALVLLATLAAPVAARSDTTVVREELYLRSGPGLTFEVIAVMPPGATVTVEGEPQEGWFPVTYNDLGGWAYGAYLGEGDAPGEAVGALGAATVITSWLNLRSGPGLGFDVIAELAYGLTVEIVGGPQEADGHSWLQVRAGEAGTGWVSGEYVQMGEAVPAPAPAPSVPAPVPPTATPAPPPTATAVLPTATPAPPTATPRPPTATPGPPTATAAPPTATPARAGVTPTAPPANTIVAIITDAAKRYNQSPEAMIAVARCESNLDPNAYNRSSGASGLFQFLPGTWRTTPYASANIFDPVASANAAAWMWSVGRRGEWVC